MAGNNLKLKCVILTTHLFINVVIGGGQLWMRMVSFVNPDGRGNNGHYCDGKFFIRGSDCDHKITICIDDEHGSNSMSRCRYGRVDTGEISNANTINFYSRAGRLPNPMTFSVNSWPGSVKIKVSVWDIDQNNDDFVDFMKLIYFDTAGYNSSIGSSRWIIRNRVRLTVELKVYCDTFYYGRDCSNYCYSRNDVFGHYHCDVITGNKICMEGWRGTDCNVRTDMCEGSPCHNGAICHNGYNRYTCVCQDGYTGNNCEIEKDECASNPCDNGGSCIDLVNGYDCRCDAGWQGTNCETNMNECEQFPCSKGSTCTDTDGSFHCSCLKGWTGERCTVDINECESNPCANGGNCQNQNGSFTCHCGPGFNGKLCESDINECDISVCHGNATCENIVGSFICRCPLGMTGDLCDIDVNECNTNPCHRSATCQNTVGSFTCRCPPGMTGENDQSVIYLKGKVDFTTRNMLIEGIKTIFQDYGGLNKSDLKLNMTAEYVVINKTLTLTKINVAASASDTLICGDILGNVIKTLDLNKINELLPFPLFNDEVTPVVGQLQTAEKESLEAWISIHWYIIVVTAIALIVIVAVVITVIVWKRRRKSVELNRNRTNTMITISDGGTIDHGVPALSFNNELYTEYRPPEQIGLMYNYTEEELQD